MSTSTTTALPRFAERLRAAPAYSTPAAPFPIDLHLDANEGDPPPADLISEALALAIIERYPSATTLEAQLAARFEIDPARLILTAGADDALLRICLAFLEPGREALVTAPTFEIIPRSIRLAGASAIQVPWPTGNFPITAFAAARTPRTAAAFIVSPNNPTGAWITRDDLAALRESLADTPLILDLAYTEFAAEDLTPFALTLPSTTIVRTLSKAWGLAGLRIGYAIAPCTTTAAAIRAAGNPYPVSVPALAIASLWLDRGENEIRRRTDANAQRCDQLSALLRELNITPLPSQANFILADFADTHRAHHTANSLARRGIAVRRFPPSALTATSLRITCPTTDHAMTRLETALREACPLQNNGEHP